MTKCRVPGCRGPWRGQMVSCPAHWSMLPEELRSNITATYDLLEEEQRRGNVRRDTREALKLFVVEADACWRELAAKIEPLLLEHEPRGEGTVWLRALRREEERKAALEWRCPWCGRLDFHEHAGGSLEQGVVEEAPSA